MLLEHFYCHFLYLVLKRNFFLVISNLNEKFYFRFTPLSSVVLSGLLRGKVTVVSAALAEMFSTGAELGRGKFVPPAGLRIYAVVVSIDLLFASSN